MLLFPNPAYDILYIDNMDNAENLQMMIYNSTGQLILKRILEEGITTIDADNFLAGLYNVIIFDDSHNHLVTLFSEMPYVKVFHGKVVDML